MRLDRLRRYDEGGQVPDPMQILQAYAQANQMDEETFAQFMQEFQSMAPQEQQHVLQVITQQLQAQQQTPQGQMPLREGDEMPQQDPSQNPMIAQLGGMMDNSTYDPYTRSYTLPKAQNGIDPSQYPTPVKSNTKKIVKAKPTIQDTELSMFQKDSSSLMDMTTPDTTQNKSKSVELLKPKDSFNLAEILNNDAANYKKIDDRNKKGFDYIETNETEKSYISGGSGVGGLGMDINVPAYAKVPIKPQILPKRKSNDLTSIYTYNNGDTILLDPKSAQFVKRNNKTGKYQPITELDMQTAYNLGLPKSKKLIEKYHAR